MLRLMKRREHRYAVNLQWTGNTGPGTSSYTSYSRNHDIQCAGKPPIACSADPAFRGDGTRYNPEELFVAAVAACHELWFLHLCANKGLILTAYEDHAEGRMEEGGEAPGRFVRVTLHPQATFASPADPEVVRALHAEAHRLCYVANTLNCPVEVEPAGR